MAKKEAAKTVETKTEGDARGTENLRYIYTGAG